MSDEADYSPLHDEAQKLQQERDAWLDSDADGPFDPSITGSDDSGAPDSSLYTRNKAKCDDITRPHARLITAYFVWQPRVQERRTMRELNALAEQIAALVQIELNQFHGTATISTFPGEAPPHIEGQLSLDDQEWPDYDPPDRYDFDRTPEETYGE